MTRVVFVRHGETAYNVRGVISSKMPGPGLNANGRHQARQLAAALATSRMYAVYTSPLRRARQTARIVAQPHGLVPVVLADLRECEVGALEGRSDAEAFVRYHEAWDRWLAGERLDYPLGPGGETGYAALARIRSATESVCTDDPDRAVILVSHAGILHFALNMLLSNVSAAWTATLPIPNAGAIAATYSVDGLRCETWCGYAPPDTAPVGV